MEKIIKKISAVFLVIWMPIFSVLAFDDDWSDFGDLPPIYENQPAEEPAPEAAEPVGEPVPSYSEPVIEPTPSYSEPAPATDPVPAYSEPANTAPVEPAYSSEPDPSYTSPTGYGSSEYISEPDPYDAAAAAYSGTTGSEASSKYVSIIKRPRNGESEFQNAIIEGVQVVTEAGKTPDEKIITCYFIFRDNPSNYFYEVNAKEKKLIFEFKDTRTGTSPVTTIEEKPIKGFSIEEMQVDGNKDIKGLNPEWHDQIRVSFDLEKIPVFTVSDDQSIISFKYKWTTDPEKIPLYVQKDRFPQVFLWSGVGLGSLGAGLLTYFLIKEPPQVIVSSELDVSDLPKRPDN